MSRVRECALQIFGRRLFQTERKGSANALTQEAVEFVYEKLRSLEFRFVVPYVKSLEVATLHEQTEKSITVLELVKEKGTQSKPLSSGLERRQAPTGNHSLLE